MGASTLSPELARQLAALYIDMERAYDQVARSLDFSCQGCPDNCCDSFFYHHTYIEWAYLWEGLHTLPADRLEKCRQQAAAYVRESDRAQARGERPQLMCPLNEDGLCMLYPYRLMICRLHGVPAILSRPDGRQLRFPGCFRCQELSRPESLALDRTPLYRRLVNLELAFLGPRRQTLPKVNLTLADMLVKGPPPL